MTKELILRLLICLAVSSLFFYQIIQKQNQINYLSLQIPKLTKDLKTLEEENLKLQFHIDSFESPDHLMHLVKLNAFSHLRYLDGKEVMQLPEGIALKSEQEDCQKSLRRFKTEPVLAVGAKP